MPLTQTPVVTDEPKPRKVAGEMSLRAQEVALKNLPDKMPPGSDPPPRTGWSDWFWWLYCFSPLVMDDVRRHVKTALLPLHNLRVPVFRLEGKSHLAGRRATMIQAGDETGAGVLDQYLFAEEPRRQIVDRVPFWTLPRTLKRLRTSADITLARVDRITARRFYGRDYLDALVSVAMHVIISNDPVDLANAGKNTADDLRRVKKGCFEHQIAHSDEDFREFYDHFHVPTMHRRHGRFSVIYNFHLLKRMFRRGGLLWILQNGRRVAGGVFSEINGHIETGALGVEAGRDEHIKNGALAALYVFLTRYARERSCRRISLGGTPAALRNGIFIYKRKWGVVVPGECTPDELLIHWNRFDDLVADFFARAAPIFRDHGGLSAMTAVHSDRPAAPAAALKLHRDLWIKGLRRLYVVSAAGWEPPGHGHQPALPDELVLLKGGVPPLDPPGPYRGSGKRWS